jgi:heavy metal translocating P-type ATPase
MHDVLWREHAEPRDGFEPVPFWVSLVFGALLAWGGYYIGSNSVDFRRDVYDRSDLKMDDGGGIAANAPDPDPQTVDELMRIGQQKYQAICAACHQPNGQGNPGQNIPPLDGSEWLVGERASAARLSRIVLYGLSGPIDVKGRTYQNAVMPNQGNVFKDYEIASVLTYVRNSWSNKADAGKPPVITASVVRAVRAEEGPRKTNGTQSVSQKELLEKYPVPKSDIVAPAPKADGRQETGDRIQESSTLSPDSCPPSPVPCLLSPESCSLHPVSFLFSRGLGIRLGMGILIVAQSMIFGLALNLHDDVPPEVRRFAQTFILVATLIVVALLGGPLFWAAYQELRRGRLTLEALFLLTMTGAMTASLQAHITGRGKIYFEVVSVLLVVYTFGKVIGSRSRSAALDRSQAWTRQLSACRRVDAKGQACIVPVAEILPGDLIEVNPGETVAVDGVIREGAGFVSEAPVSGEPFAVVRRSGDQLLAGTTSYDAMFRIEATAKGTERQVDQLLDALEQARNKSNSFQSQADRLGRVFFPLIVLTALSTFGYWTFLTPSGWEAGLFNAMSVLLVACPCAIGLATPIAIWSALGKLAERGLIVRAGDAIEKLAEVDCVMLDKTGTLTDDSFTLLDIATIATGEERAKLLGWLALIQERSRHPVARAFARLPRLFHPDAKPRIVSLQVVAGCGVEAEIEEANGTCHTVQTGTPEWVSSVCRSGCVRQELTAQLRATGHRIAVAVDRETVALAVLAEQLRDSAQQAIIGFQQLGLKVEVLTGDNAERASALDLPNVQSDLLPDDKLTAVESARKAGNKPLFVGDGINDAAALAAAHAGIALASGTEIAIEAAAITLHHHDLRLLPWAIELSRVAVRAIRRNLRRAVIYNLIGMTLAACGILHPVVAAVLMVASSLMLIFSASGVGMRLEASSVFPVPCLQSPIPSPLSPVSRFLSPLRRAFGHGLAFALQGVAVLLLLDAAQEIPLAPAIIGGFAVVGLGVGYLWYRWAAMPHALDMCVGMVTFGNLGMLLGWWVDNGFSPLTNGGCSHCVEMIQQGILQPWMWLGMLVGANAAMVWFRRCASFPSRNHSIAMFTGGNFGMIVGMLAGGWSAIQISAGSVTFAACLSFSGMTLGMVAGMLLGTWLSDKAIEKIWKMPNVPRLFRTRVTEAAG